MKLEMHVSADEMIVTSPGFYYCEVSLGPFRVYAESMVPASSQIEAEVTIAALFVERLTEALR